MNNLLQDLSIEVVYSKTEPNVKHKHIINNLYVIINPKGVLLINPFTNQVLLNTNNICLDLAELLLEVGKKVILMILGDSNNAYKFTI